MNALRYVIFLAGAMLPLAVTANEVDEKATAPAAKDPANPPTPSPTLLMTCPTTARTTAAGASRRAALRASFSASPNPRHAIRGKLQAEVAAAAQAVPRMTPGSPIAVTSATDNGRLSAPSARRIPVGRRTSSAEAIAAR